MRRKALNVHAVISGATPATPANLHSDLHSESRPLRKALTATCLRQFRDFQSLLDKVYGKATLIP